MRLEVTKQTVYKKEMLRDEFYIDDYHFTLICIDFEYSASHTVIAWARDAEGLRKHYLTRIVIYTKFVK